MVAEEVEPGSRRWLALIVCCSALFMTLLDVSVTNVALPSIGRATGASPSQLLNVRNRYNQTHSPEPRVFLAALFLLVPADEASGEWRAWLA